MMSATALSMSASGSTMPWFLAPPMHCTRLPSAAPRAYTCWAMSDEPTKLTALIAGCAMMASTTALSPCTTLSTPAGRPASIISSASRTGTLGSRSEGLRMNALPAAMAGPNIHIGIIAGKLNGVMPATTPSGWRNEYTSMPGPAPSVYSPLSRCGMPHANSITSSPRWMSPRASDSTLPCSDESSRASASMSASSRRLNSNITRARRCGLTAAHSRWAATAPATAASSSAAVASGTRACTLPLLGSNTSPWRPETPATCRPSMKWSIWRMDSVLWWGRRLHDPGVVRIVAEQPAPLRPRHDVEVVQVVAVGGADRVVAARHQHRVAVADGDGLVERAVAGVDALERKALRRADAVVVGFLQRGFLAGHGGVVLVRRVAGPVPARRHHLHHQQAVGRLGLGQDVAHVARIGAGAANLARHPAGVDHPRRLVPPARRGADRKLGVAARGHAPGHPGRHVDRARGAILERRRPPAESGEGLVAGGDVGAAGNQHQAGFAAGLAAAAALAVGEPGQAEADVRPAGAGRGHVDDGAVGTGGSLADVESGHQVNLAFAACCLSVRRPSCAYWRGGASAGSCSASITIQPV